MSVECDTNGGGSDSQRIAELERQVKLALKAIELLQKLVTHLAAEVGLIA